MWAAPSFALQQLQWSGLGSRGLATLSPCLGSVQHLLKLMEEATPGQDVLPDCGHLPLGQCLSPRGFSKPPSAWLTTAGTNKTPMWLIQPELGSRIGQMMYCINSYQNTSIREKIEHKDGEMFLLYFHPASTDSSHLSCLQPLPPS